MAKIVHRHLSLATAALLIVSSAVVWTLRQKPPSDDEWTSLLSTRQSGDIHQIDIQHGSNHWQLSRDGRGWKTATDERLSLQPAIDDLASPSRAYSSSNHRPGRRLVRIWSRGWGHQSEHSHPWGRQYQIEWWAIPHPTKCMTIFNSAQMCISQEPESAVASLKIDTALLNTMWPLENEPE